MTGWRGVGHPGAVYRRIARLGAFRNAFPLRFADGTAVAFLQGGTNQEERMFGKKTEKKKVITLDDVIPAHPDEYPGKALRARLDARREELREIHTHNPSEALEDSQLGLAN
jgi:hypothetical protein